MVQAPPPAATEVPQEFVWVKSPLVVMPLIGNAALPSLVSVTVTAVLVASSGSFPKLIAWGVSEIEGASWGSILVRNALLNVLEPWKMG